MRILHICLSSFYIDNYNYQENILPIIHSNDGNCVKIIASTETFIENNKIGYIEPKSYKSKEGIPIIRVSYKKYLPQFLMHKIRHYEKVYEIIADFSPDVILFHGTSSFEINTIVKYKIKHPKVKLYIDSHADFNNSGLNFFSKNFLHKIFYRGILKKALPYVEKVLCISLECVDFANKIYKIDESKLEFFPLGGIIVEESLWKIKRKIIRDFLGITEDDILVLHTGKFDDKKCTEKLVNAFVDTKKSKLKLVIIGSFVEEEIYKKIEYFMSIDSRITFLGWKNGSELIDFLCAADLYAQPGSQSATMQNAICCKCPVMLYPYKSHFPYIKGNGFYVKTEEDIKKVFNTVIKNPALIEKMRKASYEVACNILDYKKIASRLYQ